MFIKMKNKNGFLLAEETLKIVIAVICIMFLVYFLTSLYFNKINEEKLKHAKNVLTEANENLEDSIDDVRNSGQSKDFPIINPKSWYLFSFTGKNKPDSCARKNCLCICDNVVDILGRQIKECSKEGVCLIVEDLKEFEEIEINPDESLRILIKKVNGKIEILKK